MYPIISSKRGCVTFSLLDDSPPVSPVIRGFNKSQEQKTGPKIRLFPLRTRVIPSGKQPHNYGKSPFLMGKLTISMAIFNSFLYVYQSFLSHMLVVEHG